MTKLLITEITRMGPAFCVIELQHEKERIQSIRPVPASANSWLHFPHRRGDIVVRTNSCVDFHPRPSNNPRMPRPDAVRRVKSYSAADGYVYQYYFFEGDRAQRNGSPGGEFTYVVSVDRKSAFPFKIFVKQSAMEAWARVNGRPLSSSEEYAVAKMRLFQAFDEGAVKPAPEGQQPGEVLVDESNLEEMLGRLGI
jgi:hypothetical protein